MIRQILIASHLDCVGLKFCKRPGNIDSVDEIVSVAVVDICVIGVAIPVLATGKAAAGTSAIRIAVGVWVSIGILAVAVVLVTCTIVTATVAWIISGVVIIQAVAEC